MKKIICIVVAIMLVMSIVACDSSPADIVHIESKCYSGCYTLLDWHEENGVISVLTAEEGCLIFDEDDPVCYIFLFYGEECEYCKYQNR